MGEKDALYGINGWLYNLLNGKKVRWDGLTTAKLEDITISESDREIAQIPKRQDYIVEIKGTIGRKSYYRLMFGGNKRMIRRAIRWEEKLRRQGVPKVHRQSKAAEMARFGGKNGKHNKPVISEWTMRVIERSNAV